MRLPFVSCRRFLLACCLLVGGQLAWAGPVAFVPYTEVADMDSFGARMTYLVEKALLPEAAQSWTLDAPVSRVEFVTALYALYRLNAPEPPVPSFASFTDITPEYPAYRAIELTRMALAAYPLTNPVGVQYRFFPNGHFSPNQPITRLEAWAMLQAFVRFSPPDTLADEPPDLALYDDGGSLPTWARGLIDNMLTYRLLPRTQQEEDDKPQVVEPMRLAWDTQLNAGDLVAMLMFLQFNEQAPDTLAAVTTLNDETKAAPVLINASVTEGQPPGPDQKMLTVTPAYALFQERLQVGDVVYFLLSDPLTLADGRVLPDNSKLQGTLAQASADGQQIRIRFETVTTPIGTTYPIRVSLDLRFSAVQDEGIILTGQIFNTPVREPAR